MALTLSAGLDERVITHFAARDRRSGTPVKDTAITELSDAVKYAREQGTNITSLDAATAADGTQTREAGLLQVARTALAAGERVAARLDAARNKALQEANSIERRISCPPSPRDAMAAQIESEIRVRLAAMPEREREDAIAQAFTEKNEAIIAAVLRGPALLVGIGKARHDMVRVRYQKEFHADDYDRHERLKKAIDATERMGRLFLDLVTNASESPAARLAAAARARREEASAALNSEA